MLHAISFLNARFGRLHVEERGAAAAEYGVLLVGIVAAVAAAAVLLGGQISDVFGSIF